MSGRSASLSVRNDASEMLRVAAWLEESADAFASAAHVVSRLDLVLNDRP
jgi:hypothetical protein